MAEVALAGVVIGAISAGVALFKELKELKPATASQHQNKNKGGTKGVRGSAEDGKAKGEAKHDTASAEVRWANLLENGDRDGQWDSYKLGPNDINEKVLYHGTNILDGDLSSTEAMCLKAFSRATLIQAIREARPMMIFSMRIREGTKGEASQEERMALIMEFLLMRITERDGTIDPAFIVDSVKFIQDSKVLGEIKTTIRHNETPRFRKIKDALKTTSDVEGEFEIVEVQSMFALVLYQAWLSVEIVHALDEFETQIENELKEFFHKIRSNETKLCSNGPGSEQEQDEPGSEQKHGEKDASSKKKSDEEDLGLIENIYQLLKGYTAAKRYELAHGGKELEYRSIVAEELMNKHELSLRKVVAVKAGSYREGNADGYKNNFAIAACLDMSSRAPNGKTLVQSPDGDGTLKARERPKINYIKIYVLRMHRSIMPSQRDINLVSCARNISVLFNMKVGDLLGAVMAQVQEDKSLISARLLVKMAESMLEKTKIETDSLPNMWSVLPRIFMIDPNIDEESAIDSFEMVALYADSDEAIYQLFLRGVGKWDCYYEAVRAVTRREDMEKAITQKKRAKQTREELDSSIKATIKFLMAGVDDLEKIEFDNQQGALELDQLDTLMQEKALKDIEGATEPVYSMTARKNKLGIMNISYKEDTSVRELVVQHKFNEYIEALEHRSADTMTNIGPFMTKIGIPEKGASGQFKVREATDHLLREQYKLRNSRQDRTISNEDKKKVIARLVLYEDPRHYRVTAVRLGALIRRDKEMPESKQKYLIQSSGPIRKIIVLIQQEDETLHATNLVWRESMEDTAMDNDIFNHMTIGS